MTKKSVQSLQGPSEFKQAKPDFKQLVGRLNIHQIQGVDPFGLAPIHLEPYMLDLLRYCEYSLCSPSYQLSTE